MSGDQGVLKRNVKYSKYRESNSRDTILDRGPGKATLKEHYLKRHPIEAREQSYFHL